MKKPQPIRKSIGVSFFCTQTRVQVPIDLNRKVTLEDFSITTPKGREEAFGQTDPVRIYGQDYVLRLKKAGFNVIEDAFVKSFSPEDQYRYGLLNSELIYFCSK